jgi:PAS domain S-box-containing protein
MATDRNESKRLAALESYEIMDSAAEESFDNFTQLAAQICEVPISLVSLVDGKRQWFKSKVGLDATETPREISFCQHAILDVHTFEVTNALEDSRFADNVLVTGDPNIRFYAGHPLIDENGFALGTLCVIDRIPKKLSEHQQKALELLAKQVVMTIKSRKESRELVVFKKFFNLSLEYLCIANTDGYFKVINPMFARTLGYTEEELYQQPFSELIHEEDRASTLMEVHKLSKGHHTVGFENRYRKKDGSYINLHWTAQPDPFTGEIFAAAHDITGLRKVEKLLLKSNEQLDQFAYIVSHDLKAPLRAISTLSTFLEEDLNGKLDEESKANFDLLKSRVVRMENLINGILEYSRIDKKKHELEEIDVNHILEEVKDGFSQNKNFKIEIADVLPIVKYSHIQLFQVFQNLIGNAIKYHDKEKGTITIHYTQKNNSHQFKVQDDGPGIDPDYHDKIFGVFQTLQSKDEIESTGIGLAIVKKIIENYGGKIKVKSELGKGATFIFTIPEKV